MSVLLFCTKQMGENFEKTSKGFIDFLLLDARGFPLLVLEANGKIKP